MGVCGGMVSCSMPPRQAWQHMKEQGVLRAFFVPKRSPGASDRTQRLAGADLSVDGGVNRRLAAAAPVVPVAGLPVAEEAGGCPGYVFSPRTPTPRLVDVLDFAPGETVLCPYTMEPFIVPGGAAGAGRLASTAAFGTAVPLAPEPTAESVVPTGNPAVVEVASRDLSTPLMPQMPTAEWGRWVPDKPGYVHSPFAAHHQLVDVTGIAAGTEVHCPYSGRIFRVPEKDPSPALAAAGMPEAETAFAEDAVAAATAPLPEAAAPAGAADHTEDALRILALSIPQPLPPKYGASMPLASAPLTTPPAQTEATAVPEPEPAVSAAAWVPNKPGLVQSPHSKPGEFVDVTGKTTGTKVICPFTNKPFLVPAP